jgi:hypothetical protein
MFFYGNQKSPAMNIINSDYEDEDCDGETSE